MPPPAAMRHAMAIAWQIEFVNHSRPPSFPPPPLLEAIPNGNFFPLPAARARLQMEI